jgi:hypothetical protein
MVFTVKPGLVPSSKRSFLGKVKEAATRASLETHAPDHLLVIGTRLVL